MKPSATGAVSAKAEEMRSRGIHVYTFAAGDPVLPNHPALIEAGQIVLKQGYSPYAPIAGLTELRLAAADWMKRRYGHGFEVGETVVTTGGKFGIYAALQILVSEKDEVIIPAPYWVSYPEMVQIAKGTPVIVQTRWKLTPQLLKSALTKKSRVLILNNACNPTGILYTREEMRDLLKVAADANLMIISDEVYSEIVFDGADYVSLASFPEYRSNTLIVESCSKNFGMAGWRVGFAFGPKNLIEQIIALQSQSTSGTSFLGQKIALAALQNSEIVAKYVRDAMNQRRKIFFENYNRLLGASASPPPSALYFFTPVKNVEQILKTAHVALAPGEAFGVEGYARFAFTGTEEEIIKGLEAFANYTIYEK